MRTRELFSSSTEVILGLSILIQSISFLYHFAIGDTNYMITFGFSALLTGIALYLSVRSRKSQRNNGGL